MTDIDTLLSLDLTVPANALVFRRGIAELAGWSSSFTNGYLLITDPQGRTRQGDINYPMRRIPAFETSLDAALTLPLDEGYVFELHYPLPHAEANIWHRGSDVDDISYFYKADKPAEAISKSWLLYRRAQSTREATARDEEA